MANSLLGEFGRHLAQSAALLVTLVGTIATFVYARDYLWIPLTFLLVFVSAALSFCYQMHREKELALEEVAAEKRQRTESVAQAEQDRQALQGQVDAEKRRREEVEGATNRLVAESLERYQRILERDSLALAVKELLDRLDIAKRMRLFVQALARSMEVRKIETLAGQLFVIVRLDAGPMKHLYPGDPFVLVERTPSGLENPVAALRLNQQPDPARKAAHFQVLETFGEAGEMLEVLARAEDIEPLRRYEVRPALDLTRYRSLHIEDAIEILKMFAAEPRRGQSRGERR